MEALKTEFNAIELIKIFEIEVIDKNKEKDYVIFDISIHNDTLRAEHIALTNEEEQSDKIAFKAVQLDDSFTLDELLQELHEECTNAILNSDFYTLAD